ncbi:GtrA family protein [Rhodococcus sp. G-MC3]|uniref:GtrA family protein n=1 Tax=Rhodococcus sp. G-MC3 TaxID=3046209 RepID=UPI0024BB47DE|nr:GtrA family protein [Rhodococcus sp. G-MC3]MDJ0394272.1 GtrA family protein [Rhodococcus sp. G-MC3]
MQDDETPDPAPGNQAIVDAQPTGPLMRLIGNQGVAFILVGGFNTVLGTAWFVAWQLTVGEQLGYHAAIVFGYLCNVVTAFCTNRYLVFRVRGRIFRDFWRFVVVNSGAFVINLALMTVAVSILGFTPIPSQLVITLFTAGVSFFGYRDFSFRRSASTDPSTPMKGK